MDPSIPIQAQDAAQPPEFRSLRYVEGFTLPEPATDIHLQALWAAAGDVFVTELAIIGNVCRHLDWQRDELELRNLALAALSNLRYDRLLIERGPLSSAEHSGNHSYHSAYTGEHVSLRSRTLTLSGLGLQIAAESGRRSSLGVLSLPGHTRRRGQRVFSQSLRRLVTAPNIGKPDPIGPNRIRTEQVDDSVSRRT